MSDLEESLADLIPFNGDPSTVLPWINFTIPTQHVLIRTFWRILKHEEQYTDGISYSILNNVTMQDLHDTNIGRGRAEEAFDELSKVFTKFEHDLSAQKITVDLPISDGSSIVEIQAREIEEDIIDTATTLEEIQMGILHYFNEYRKVSERDKIVLEGRNLALVKEGKSLEELGHQLGVSRERIRQIAVKYENLQLTNGRRSNDFLNFCLQILESCKSEVQFSQIIHSRNLSAKRNFKVDQFKEICFVLGLDSYIERIERMMIEFESSRSNLNLLSFEAQKYRTKTGLLDLQFMSKQTQSSISDCQAGVLIRYPRSIFFENLALARTVNNDSMFESALVKQLYICDSLTPAVLIEGLVRAASNRNTVVIGEKQQLTGLIQLIAGNPPSLQTINANLLELIGLGGVESWLVKTFAKLNQKILHRSEIMQAALEDKVNMSSVQIYLLKSPIIRSCGEAIYCLVGTEVSNAQVLLHATARRGVITQSKFEYKFFDTNVLITIEPNINAIGGVLFPPSDLKNMMKGLEFFSKCECNSLRSDQVIKVTPSNFLTGFTALFKHGMLVHGKKLGEEFIFLVDFDNKVVKLTL